MLPTSRIAAAVLLATVAALAWGQSRFGGLSLGANF